MSMTRRQPRGNTRRCRSAKAALAVRSATLLHAYERGVEEPRGGARMSKSKSKGDIETMIGRLREKHPDAKYELNWDTPEQLLVATILAAQCTDERVNKVTATLFQKY